MREANTFWGIILEKDRTLVTFIKCVKHMKYMLEFLKNKHANSNNK